MAVMVNERDCRSPFGRILRMVRSGAPRVLVVDDEPRVGRALAYAAEACGFEAALAISADTFRAQYERASPDVVLLDLSLPGGDGIELLRFLAERRSSATIFIVSGCDGRVVEAAARFGAALGLRIGGSLTKPITVAQLADALTDPDTGTMGGTDELCFG